MPRFARQHRLTHAREFRAVYEARLRRQRGPLVLSCRPNSLPHPRLGLSVGRGAGSAVRRNRVKRLVREAFRLSQDRLPRWSAGEGPPACYDYVVGVRAPGPLTLDDCRDLLVELAHAAHRAWERRGFSAPDGSAPP